jgi:hypothetical protein
MTRTTVKMDSERSIIIGLLTNKDFCSQVVPILDKKYLKTRYAKVIAEWVIDYFQAYGTAPGSLIQDMYYERKASLNEDEAQSLAEFLGSLSKEFEVSEDYNLKYELDKAEKYIKIRSLEMLKEKIDVAIAEGDAVKGESAIANYSQVGRPDSQAVSILHDTKEIFNAFSEESEYVFHWPRGIGKILPPPEFGDLIAFLAPPKGRKTWALDFTADLAAQAGHRVLFVSLEMRKTQLIRRAWQRMTSSPRYDQEMAIPYFKPCFAPDSTLPEDEKHWELYQKTETKQAIDLDSIKEFQDRAKVYYRGGDVRYLTLPAYSATVEDIISQLDNLNYYSNFSPSVLIIDYADILRPSANVKEYRHQLDDIWKKLRALAQARNILVCTASQGNRGSLGGDVTSESIAEDMRKLAHVSLLVALNSNKEDKARGTLRMKSLVQRDGETAFDEAVVLQCLAMGRFHLDSKPSRQVEF